MIYDFSIAASVNTLCEYYKQLYDLHSRGHGPDYVLVHDEIKEKLKNCNSYTELGVNQGATLAAAMLQNPKVVRAYDIALKPYNFAKHLFNEHAFEHNIDFSIFEDDTLKIDINPVDLLYIDTKHEYNHLTQELKRHGHKAKKYIIFHDTYAQQGLKKAVLEYVEKNEEWCVVTDCEQNVGFMTIKRQ